MVRSLEGGSSGGGGRSASPTCVFPGRMTGWECVVLRKRSIGAFVNKTKHKKLINNYVTEFKFKVLVL